MGFASRQSAARLAGWLALMSIAPAARAESRPMVVATQDPALLSALSAAFSPRGVRVVEAKQPFRRPTDALAAAGDTADADVVWLCEGDPKIGPALCVRPRHGEVMIRHISMTTPLTPEDAAALALSVQVALMPPIRAAARATPAAQIARAPAAAPALRAPGRRLALELDGGVRNLPAGSALRAGVAAAYTPAALGYHLGLGVGAAAGPTSFTPQPQGRATGPALQPPGLGTGSASPSGRMNDLTLRLFARGQVRLAPIWLQLDLGPAIHFMSGAAGDGTTESPADRRLHLSADGYIGAMIPFGRFFAGARAGGSYLLSGRGADTSPTGATWSREALLALGAAFN
jgi:hypothetical protein